MKLTKLFKGFIAVTLLNRNILNATECVSNQCFIKRRKVNLKTVAVNIIKSANYRFNKLLPLDEDYCLVTPSYFITSSFVIPKYKSLVK